MPYRVAPPGEGPRELDLGKVVSVAGDRRYELSICALMVLVFAIPFLASTKLHPDLLAGLIVLMICGVLVSCFFALPRKRRLRVTRGSLTLTGALTGAARRFGTLCLDDGIFVHVRRIEALLGDGQETRITLVGSVGRLEWTTAQRSPVPLERRDVARFFEDAEVAIRSAHEPLAGTVTIHYLPSGAIELGWAWSTLLSWRPNVPRHDLPKARRMAKAKVWAGLAVVGVLALALPWEWSHSLVFPASLVVMMLSLGAPRRAGYVRVVVSRDGWRLERRVGWKGAESRSYAGRLDTVLTPAVDWRGVPLPRAIELRSDGRLVATIGEDLTEPELRFIIDRIWQATTAGR